VGVCLMGERLGQCEPSRCHPERLAKDLCTFRLILMPDRPRLAQVFPFWIHGYDHRYLLNTRYALAL
jgi:hypothetical protein